MILALLLACDTSNTPEPGSFTGYTTGELRYHHTSYCDGALTISQVAPETVLSVWFCDSYDRDATCRLSPDAAVEDVAGMLTVTCPESYEGSGYARSHFLPPE